MGSPKGLPGRKEQCIRRRFLLILMGIPMILLPEVAFFISYGWMLKNAEPSDGMITYTRICGGVFILIGIVVLFL